jgi:hypothetical protein
MNEIEFQHIAPYLGHNLRVKRQGSSLIGFLSGADFVTEVSFVTFKGGSEVVLTRDLVPALKSMDSFTGSQDAKEMQKILGLPEDADLRFSKEKGFTFQHNRASSIVITYAYYRELCSRHYDVLGLIESGLAIDINTIENEGRRKKAERLLTDIFGKGKIKALEND